LNLPSENPHVTSNDQTRVLWSGPNVWIVISKKTDINTVIQSSCNENDFAITDLSHSRAAIKLEGPKALDVLKKGSPLNFNEEVFKVNHCASTTYNGINILIDYINSNPKTLHLYALRSFGGSFYHSITDSALEYGYEGV
jgi:sarcosine oxidase subunit gamma